MNDASGSAFRLACGGAEPRRFEALDAWRGVAALMVALYRFDADGIFQSLPFIRSAFLFVDFFFVLSGFVIAHAYLAELRSAADVGAFFVRRVVRLWPLHLAILLCFIAMEIARLAMGAPAFAGYRAPWTLIPEIFLLQGIGVTGATAWNSPAWSISTEMWTYLIFAILAVSCRRRMAVVSVAIVVVCLAVVSAWSHTFMNATFDFGLFRCMAGFFAGVATYVAWRAAARRAERAVRPWTWAEGACVAAALLFASTVGQGAGSLAAPLVFAMLIYVFAFEQGALSQALSLPPFKLLGRLSYSIYMVALLVVTIFSRLAATMLGAAGVASTTTRTIGGSDHLLLSSTIPGLMDGLAVIYLAIVVLVAMATFRFIETPAQTAFRRRRQASSTRIEALSLSL